MSINQISELLIAFLYQWQDLLGAMLGAFAAFMVWFISEVHRRYQRRQEYMVFLHRSIVDQANLILDSERTIKDFITNKLSVLLAEPRDEGEGTYTVDRAFFPLFSTRNMSEKVLEMSTLSGYLDNKVMRAYSLSQDFPHIIDDIKRQFEDTLHLNKEMAFGKLNPPAIQRQHYLIGLASYRESVRADMLSRNFPVFIKLLVECLISIEEMQRLGVLRWRFKFDPRYKFYLTRASFRKALSENQERMRLYFEPLVSKRINELSLHRQE